MKLMMSCNNNIKEITIDIGDVYLDKGPVLLNPNVKDNGILKILRKERIIKEISGTFCYDYMIVPVAIINTGILKNYDYIGVMKYLEKRKIEEA